MAVNISDLVVSGIAVVGPVFGPCEVDLGAAIIQQGQGEYCFAHRKKQYSTETALLDAVSELEDPYFFRIKQGKRGPRYLFQGGSSFYEMRLRCLREKDPTFDPTAHNARRELILDPLEYYEFELMGEPGDADEEDLKPPFLVLPDALSLEVHSLGGPELSIYTVEVSMLPFQTDRPIPIEFYASLDALFCPEFTGITWRRAKRPVLTLPVLQEYHTGPTTEQVAGLSLFSLRERLKETGYSLPNGARELTLSLKRDHKASLS